MLADAVATIFSERSTIYFIKNDNNNSNNIILPSSHSSNQPNKQATATTKKKKNKCFLQNHVINMTIFCHSLVYLIPHPLRAF